MVGQQFTPEERTFIVLSYDETKSSTETIQAFVGRFPNRNPPTRKTVLRNFKKYQKYGTSHNRNKGNSGRPRSARTQTNIDAVRRELQANPEASARRNNIPQLTKSSFNRITKYDLKLHPFRMNIQHQLFPRDYQRRVDFCRWFVARPPRFHNSDLLIGDESTFRMDGKVNTWNARSYAPKKHPPENFNFQRKFSDEKVTVWAGIFGNGRIVGPYFFEGNVDKNSYLAMLDEFVVPNIRNQLGMGNNGRFTRGWWIQDAAPAHRAEEVVQRLRQLFGNRVIALGFEHEWPPRSCDLSPLDFFLWGYLKNQVYKTVPTSLDDLRERIRHEFAVLKRTRMARRAVRAMRTRAEKCINLNGGHVKGRQ